MKSSRLCLGLLVAESVLIIVSWLLSAMRLEGVRSMLSSEGIRWFVGGFSDIVASPLLAWLLLALIAVGSVVQSGVVVFLVLYTLVVCLLAFVPHAILLSVKGSLFPSAFSRSLVPIVCFGITLFSVVYGMMSGHKKTGEDIIDILSYGIRQGASLIVVYILAIQLYASLRFVFMF